MFCEDCLGIELKVNLAPDPGGQNSSGPGRCDARLGPGDAFGLILEPSI